MKVVIQRVKTANVCIDGMKVGAIETGLLLLLGIGKDDTEAILDKYIDKIIKLRIFEDENGKTNRSLMDIGGELLVVSQFTLYANCRKGNRPSFTEAASSFEAEQLYEKFVQKCRERLGRVESGKFGANMQVSLINDGPFTIVLDDAVVLKN
ncbi:MAG: D-aminoacyl-tRNA deacylase [Velocimicrobium sp.]